MTKQEAIELLYNLIGMIEDNQNNDYDAALRMAIEALTKPEIVRCRYCKNYDLAPNGVNGFCNRQYATFYSWDFCSYGDGGTDG